MRKAAFVLGLLCLGNAKPVPADELKGTWYSSYNTGIGGIEVSIDLDHLPEGRSGTASISFIQTAPDITCPREAHPAFCEELSARSKRSPNGAFFAEDEGVLYEGDDEAFVAFRFPDETETRLLAINRNNPSSPMAGVRFYHPKRGIDAQVNAKKGRYFCETTQCSSELRDELKNDPQKALGLFATRSFLFKFNPYLDERAEAHETARSSLRQDNGFGKYESVGQYLTAVWKVTNRQNLALGQLRLFGTGSKFWGGQGELSDQNNSGQSLTSVRLKENGRNEQLVNFIVNYGFDNNDGVEPGELTIFLPPLPQNKISAVVTQSGTKTRVILERLGNYEGEAEGDVDGLPSELNLTDLRFSLRNVPADRMLVVRQAPDRTSIAVGQVPPSASDLRVSRCEPNIDPMRFSSVSFEGKLELLAGTWCEISSEEAGVNKGFVLGRYLSPQGF
ncbi:MAG: hypothetical protein AAGF54_08875 [Pseudomonadota bacterium]